MAWVTKIGSGKYLTRSELENNALLVRAGLEQYGFTLASISGIMGNIQQESDGNPGLTDGNAWGLTQFDPYTRLTSYCDLYGLNWYDGDAQLRLINDEGYYTHDDYSDFARQWIPKPPYEDITWDDFKKLTDPGLAAKVYLRNNERPAVLDYENRATLAIHWYEFYGGQPVPPTPTIKKKLKLYMMLRLPRRF